MTFLILSTAIRDSERTRSSVRTEVNFSCAMFRSIVSITLNATDFCPVEISVKTKLVSRPITKTHMECLEVKMFTNEVASFLHSFRGKIFFKMPNLSGFFVCEDGKQLFIVSVKQILMFYAKKSSESADDAEVSELCGSAPPHPIRCPVRF